MTTDTVTPAHTDAFHVLGTGVTGAFTAEEAMTAGKLGGWNVRKMPLFAMGDEGVIQVPDKFASVRDNPDIPGQVDVLGVVGKAHATVQNEEHAEFLNTLVDESGAHFETAGSTDGGRRVFVSMKLPGHIKIGGIDQVDNYISAINSHDGSMAFTFLITPIRFRCMNICNFALKNKLPLVRVRHTSGVKKQLVTQVRQALDITFDYLEEFQVSAERLIDKSLTQQRFENIIAKNFGAPEGASKATVTRAENRMDQMSQLFADAVTQEGIRGTAWAGLNAITEWADHYAPARGGDANVSRAQRALLDPKLKNKALQLMMAVK